MKANVLMAFVQLLRLAFASPIMFETWEDFVCRRARLCVATEFAIRTILAPAEKDLFWNLLQRNFAFQSVRMVALTETVRHQKSALATKAIHSQPTGHVSLFAAKAV